jgi:hypothetical protein
MFRALLSHPQEALHIRRLAYCVRVMSVGCTGIGVFHSSPGAANWHNTHVVCQAPFVEAPAEDEQVMFETFRGP